MVRGRHHDDIDRLILEHSSKIFLGIGTGSGGAIDLLLGSLGRRLVDVDNRLEFDVGPC